MGKLTLNFSGNFVSINLLGGSEKMEVTLPGKRAFFPPICSKCLAPNPERNFKIEGSTSRGKRITTWSYDNVPICNSCYKRKHWTLSSVFRILGWFVTFFGFLIGLAVHTVIPLPLSGLDRSLFIMYVYSGIGVAILICTTIYRLRNPRPVKMRMVKTNPPLIKFIFENQKYGQMFNNTNGGTCVTSVDSPFPESMGPSGANIFLKIMSFLIGIMFTFVGIMTLASSVILARIGITLLLGSGSLLFGVLSLFGGYSFGKRKNRRGGLLLIFGLIIFIITITISLALE